MDSCKGHGHLVPWSWSGLLLRFASGLNIQLRAVIETKGVLYGLGSSERSGGHPVTKQRHPDAYTRNARMPLNTGSVLRLVR